VLLQLLLLLLLLLLILCSLCTAQGGLLSSRVWRGGGQPAALQRCFVWWVCMCWVGRRRQDAQLTVNNRVKHKGFIPVPFHLLSVSPSPGNNASWCV
jgi:hypothetical protein